MAVEAPTRQEEFNPYEILGLRKWASAKEIKRAYFSLVRKYSPERFPEKFVEIRRAYDALRIPANRAKVDFLLFSEIPGAIGFKGVEVKTESLVKLNKQIKDIESSKGDHTAVLLDLLRKRSLVYVSKSYWQEAIADWSRILQIHRGDREARRNLILGYSRLGFSYAQNGFLKRAVEAWKEILKYSPRCPEAVHNLAIASTRLKQPEEEKKYWEKILEVWSSRLDQDSDNEYLKNLLVETHKYFGGRFIPPKKDREDTQPKKYEEVLGQIGGFLENMQLGMACMNNKNWPQAIAAFEKCLTERPDDVEILNALGWAYLNSTNINKAFATWNRALRVDPRNQTTQENLVQGHLTVGKNLRAQKAFGPALVHFKNILKVMPNQPEVFMEIGNTYAMKGDYLSAIEQWETVLELDPNNKLAKQAIREAKMHMRS